MKYLNSFRKILMLTIAVMSILLSTTNLYGQKERPVDTVDAQLCARTFPTKYMGEIITRPGAQYVHIKNRNGVDSIIQNLTVRMSIIDSVRMSDCANNFPLTYDSIVFSGTVHQEISYSTDEYGCPIYHRFDIEMFDIYNDTIIANVCESDTPFVFSGNQYSENGIHVFQNSSVFGCDSITTLIVNITPEYNFKDTLTDTICSYDLPYFIGGHEFSEAGTYDFPILSSVGCDSIQMHLTLHVQQTYFDTLHYDVCASDFPFVLDSVHTYEEAGTYPIVHSELADCPSVTYVILDEQPVYNDTIRVNICSLDSTFIFADTSFTESTVYTHLGTTIQGCDSLTTLILNIGQNYNDTLYDTLHLCRYELPYLYNNQWIEEEGSHIIDLKTILNCDSTHIELAVYVENPPVDTAHITLCSNQFPYHYGDTLLSMQGEYDVVIPNEIGGTCDTLRHLIVDSVSTYSDSVFVTLCANTPYVIGDSVLTEPGTYDIMLQSIYGCDSLITVTITHFPIYNEDTLTFTTCQNELPFVYDNMSYTTPGYHQILYTSKDGCDSIITINLNIQPVIYNADTLYETICANQLPYTTHFGERITEAGLHTFVTTSTITGCDSVFYYKLTVNENPTPRINGSTFICSGTSVELTAPEGMSAYRWNNGSTSQIIEVSVANIYRVTVTDGNGCQGSAIFTTYEAALPIIHLSAPQSICRGSSAVITVSGTDHYVWENGSTTTSITVYPTETTTYHVTAYSSTPCQREGNITIVVNDLPNAVIVGESSFCQGSNTMLLASGGTNYRWSNNSNSDRITVFTEGTYTVTVTDDNGCSNMVSKVISVHDLPTITINGRTPFCQGQSTTLTASGAVSYIWSTAETTSSITTSFADTYTVTGTDANGCSSSASKTITIWQISAQITGNRYFCQGEHTTLNVIGNENYSYQWNDGSTSNTLDIYTPGNYSVIVTNSLGCSNTISATVSEYALPTPSISGTPIICQGRSTMLLASGGNRYSWSNGSNNAYISVNETGTYFVTVTNQLGCSATTSETVIVNPLPSIVIDGRQDICQGESVSLFAQSPTGTHYNWPMSGLQSPFINVTPTNTTTYSVMVTDENGCSNTASTTISVHENPTLYLSGVNTICQGDTAVLVVNGGQNYIWSNGMTSNTVKLTRAGQYSVTAFNSYNCSSSANTTITVNNLPDFNLTPDTAICQGESLILTASAPSNCTYEWSNGSTASHITVNTAGNYRVTVTTTSGCSRTRSVNVTVNSKPQISISGSTVFCQDGSTILNAVCESGTPYQWNNGVVNAPLTISEAGTYTVVATNAYGCTQSASTTVSMFPRPSVEITGTTLICPGYSTSLIVSESAHYRWSTGDTTRSITATPSANTSYQVTITDRHGCQASTSTNVQVSSVPDIQIIGATSFCSGESTTLTVTPGYSYLWSNNSTSSSITVHQSGTYKVTASNALGCITTDSITVTALPLPELNFGVQHTICAGQSYTYQLPNIEGISYIWSNASTGNTLTVTETGTYRVTATNQYGCSVSAYDNLIVVPLPAPSITGSLVICKGGGTVLTAAGGSSYHWSNGSTTRDIAVFPTTSTSYAVTVTDENNCSSNTSVNVIVNTLPTINISGSRTFCEGGSTTLTAMGAASYNWSNGTSTSTIHITQPGTYTVTASNALNCTSTDSVVITQLENPNIEISGQDLICFGSLSTLNVQGGVTYVWSTDEHGSSINIMPTSTTTYSVTGYDAHGCSSNVSKVINVEALPNVHITGENVICLGDSTIFTASGASSYMWSTGSTANQITVYNGGNYSVTATSEHGCSASTSAALLINPTPVVTISGSNTICSNTTSLLKAAGGINYRWSNGSTDTSITISRGGNYSVTASNIYGCSASTDITVSELTAPIVFLNSMTSLCQGGSTSILAYSSANNYLWSTGETTQNIEVSPTESTTYVVTVTNEEGCSKSDSVHLTVNPTYNINVTDNICQGAPYKQYGFDLPAQTTPGTFTFTNYLQSRSGCDSIINLQLTVKPLPQLPETISGNSVITAYGPQLYNVDSTQYANSYEWRVSNTHWELSGSTTSSTILSINTNGSGLLTVKAINNCGSVEKSLFINCSVGVEEYSNESNIILYPVPTKDILNINLEQSTVEISNIQLVDQMGRTLQNVKVTDNLMQLDCSAYAAGHYFVRFLDQNGRRIDTRKIIINK